MQRTPLTAHGAEKLQEELRKLKSEDRPRIIAAIAEARAHGDLKENAEYHAAKEQQGFAEGRIKDIEAKLSNAIIIDVTKMTNDGTVIFGSTVKLVDEETGDEVTYHIVGEDEANIKQGKISVTSPVARAMIGKKVGDIASVNAPNGLKEYEILNVRYE